MGLLGGRVQLSEVRGRRAEDRRQKTEGRGQRSDNEKKGGVNYEGTFS